MAGGIFRYQIVQCTQHPMYTHPIPGERVALRCVAFTGLQGQSVCQLPQLPKDHPSPTILFYYSTLSTYRVHVADIQYVHDRHQININYQKSKSGRRLRPNKLHYTYPASASSSLSQSPAQPNSQLESNAREIKTPEETIKHQIRVAETRKHPSWHITGSGPEPAMLHGSSPFGVLTCSLKVNRLRHHTYSTIELSD